MKKKLIGAALVALALAGGLTVNSLLAAGTPGSTEDPLVSQSYVDDKINELILMMKSQSGSGSSFGLGTGTMSENEILAGVMAQLESYYPDSLGGGGKYTPVFAGKGQTVIGGEGTEIILRSGGAKGYILGANGIVNITDGSEIFHGTEVKANNLLIVPRDDGRGLSITADAWLLIKGSYELRN